MQTKHHFVQPIGNDVIQLVTLTIVLANSAPADECIFLFKFFFFFLGGGGGGLQKLAHLPIYLHTKCSRSVSERKTIFRNRLIH